MTRVDLACAYQFEEYAVTETPRETHWPPDDHRRQYLHAMRDVYRAPTPYSAHQFFCRAHHLSVTSNRRRHLVAHIGLARHLAAIGDLSGARHHLGTVLISLVLQRRCGQESSQPSTPTQMS